jgi:ADP-ribose pyrophosphatase
LWHAFKKVRGMAEEKLLLQTERFRVMQVTRDLPSGGSKTRAVVRHPGAVAILPIFENGNICLIKNYRITVQQTLYELPAGTLEPNEPPLETARRELLEETGFRATSLEFFAAFYLAPGILDERMHLYIAQGLTAGATALEHGEEIENCILSWSDALTLIDNGLITDGKTIAALLMYERYLQRNHKKS